MYIYNVTVTLDQSIHQDWLVWIKSHIPELLATGRFVSARLNRVLVEKQTDEITYAVQYTAKTRSDLEAYYKEDAPKLRSDGIQKFADKMHIFRTELKVIDEFYPKATKK